MSCICQAPAGYYIAEALPRLASIGSHTASAGMCVVRISMTHSIPAGAKPEMTPYEIPSILHDQHNMFGVRHQITYLVYWACRMAMSLMSCPPHSTSAMSPVRRQTAGRQDAPDTVGSLVYGR